MNAIVMTTINIPTVLDSYLANLREFDRLKDTFCIVVGDYKTPSVAEDYCHGITDEGLDTTYLGIAQQKHYLGSSRALRHLDGIIPWNSDARRNIGYLYAVAHGADIIISIDDDNYAIKGEDFIGGHTSKPTTAISSVNAWVNPCRPLHSESLVEENNSHVIYQRGFPYCRRWQDTFVPDGDLLPVMVNQGMWLGSPDVDAVANLETPRKVVAKYRGHIALAPGHWAPLNSQNTSFHREILPAWYFVPPVINGAGARVTDRYGDVWCGYFVEKVLHSLGYTVSYGQPIVEHRRNSHNYLSDLQMELGGMLATEPLVNWLEKLCLPASADCATLYVSLGVELAKAVVCGELHMPNDILMAYFRDLRHEMEIWVDACAEAMA